MKTKLLKKLKRYAVKKIRLGAEYYDTFTKYFIEEIEYYADGYGFYDSDSVRKYIPGFCNPKYRFNVDNYTLYINNDDNENIQKTLSDFIRNVRRDFIIHTIQNAKRNNFISNLNNNY